MRWRKYKEGNYKHRGIIAFIGMFVVKRRDWTFDLFHKKKLVGYIVPVNFMDTSKRTQSGWCATIIRCSSFCTKLKCFDHRWQAKNWLKYELLERLEKLGW